MLRSRRLVSLGNPIKAKARLSLSGSITLSTPPVPRAAAPVADDPSLGRITGSLTGLRAPATHHQRRPGWSLEEQGPFPQSGAP
jgi:hypothetical protein